MDFIIKVSLPLFFSSRSISPLIFNYPLPWLAQCLALCFTFIYAELVGWSLPTQRAWFMLMLLILPAGIYIDVPFGRRLLLTFMSIVAFNSSSLCQAGFWLSFSAVAFIAYVSRARLGRLPRWVDWLNLNAAVTLGLLPFTLFFFRRMSVIAPLTNLLAVPWMTVIIVPACLLSVIISLFSTHLAMLGFSGVSDLLQPLWAFLTDCSHWHMAMIYSCKITYSQLFLGFFSVIMLLSGLPFSVRLLGVGYLSALYCS